MMTRRELLQTAGGLRRAGIGFTGGGGDLAPGAGDTRRRRSASCNCSWPAAASHIDLFDFKPELVKRHGQESDFGEKVEAFQNGLGPWLKPVWDFKQYGACGKLLSELVAPLGDCVDDMAFIHNMVGKTGVHSRARCCRRPASSCPGFPGMGAGSATAWAAERQPADVRRAARPPRLRLERRRRTGAPASCPPQHQGTLIHPGTRERRSTTSSPPRPAATSPREPTRQAIVAAGRSSTAKHAAAARGRLAARRPHPQLRTGRPDAARRARRCSTCRRETARTTLSCTASDASTRPGPTEINAAGGDAPLRPQLPGRPPAAGARRALRADLERRRQRLPAPQLGLATRTSPATTARWPRAWPAGAAALIKDLKQRGLLDDTIVLWTTEFGRMPCSQGGKGRDHNPFVFTNWLAGGGIKGGVTLRRKRRVVVQAADRNSRPTATTSTPRSCTCSASTTSG